MGYNLILVQSIGDILPALTIADSLSESERSHLVFLNIPDDLVALLVVNLPKYCTYERRYYKQLTFRQPISVYLNWLAVNNYAKNLTGVHTVYYFSNNYDWFTAKLITQLGKKNDDLNKFIYPHFDSLSPEGKSVPSTKQNIIAFLWSLFSGVKCRAKNKVRYMNFELGSIKIELKASEKLQTLKKYQINLNHNNRQVIIFADVEEWSHFKNPESIYDNILFKHRKDMVYVKSHPKHSVPKYFDNKNVIIMNNKIPIEFYRLENVARIYGLITSALITFNGNADCERISLLNFAECKAEDIKAYYSKYLNNSAVNILYKYE